MQAGGRLIGVAAGQELYAERAASDSFFVVVEGAVALSTIRRGDEVASEIRRAGPGDTFGEEPLLAAGAVRRSTAIAAMAGTVVEIPAALYTRVAGKIAGTDGVGGGDGGADVEVRRLRRNAASDLLRTMAATRDLPDAELGLMLDAIEHVEVPRGQRIFAPGDRADGYYLVDSGLVQLQTEDPQTGEIGVCGYVGRGDGFGHDEALSGQPRALAAVSMGHTRVVRVPAGILRTIVDRNRDVARHLSRVTADREQRQAAAVAAADVGSTRHVFHDLYRMQVARSMLVIDQESCVRCGHCAWTCASLYGTARLVRRGDKVVTRVAALASGPSSLMVVNSCQHCKNPVCMLDCPTGAIGRDPEGEVFIEDALCTGCGACAKACPWENIRMATRPGATPGSGATGPGTSEVLATKCDLCRDYEAPGCVSACPTDAITRLDPSRDVADVAGVLGVDGPKKTDGSRGLGSAILRGATIVVGLGLSAWALAQHRAGVFVPHAGMGWALGWVALVGMLGSASYAGVKRLPRLWMRRRRKDRAEDRRAALVNAAVGAAQQDAPPRSKTRGWLDLHLVLGTTTIAAVCGHAGASLKPGPYGSLLLASWAVFALGILGALVYRLVPRRLARLERRGALPEDLAAEQHALEEALFPRLSGSSKRVKAAAAKMLVPYTRAMWGPWVLLLSGRTERAERKALRERIEYRFPPQTEAAADPEGHEARTLDELVRIAVQLRTVPARRALTLVLRAWLPIHAALTGIVLALLAVHIAIALGRPG